MQRIRHLSWKQLLCPAGGLLLAGALFPEPFQRKVARSQSKQDCLLRGWLQKRGGRLAEHLTVSWLPGRGRGVVASFSVYRGEVVAEIPWPLIVSCKQAMEDPDVCCWLRELRVAANDTGSCAIRLWLLRHLHDATSPWQPWLCQLPQDAGAGSGCLPLVLAHEGSTALRGTPLQRQSELLLQRLRAEWEVLEPLTARHPWLPRSWQWWLWAQAIVSTRSGTLLIEGSDESVQCVIPVLDFLNHSAEPNACIVGTATGAKLVATRDIEAGQELLISYGPHSTEQFLFAFGFVPDGSLADIAVPLALTEASARVRADLLGPGRPLSLCDESVLESVLAVLAVEPQFRGWSRRRHLEYLQGLFEAWHSELTRSRVVCWQRRYPEAETLRHRYATAVASVLQTVRVELTHQP